MPKPATPNPGVLCGTKKRGKNEHCVNRAGQGTSHVGFGPCDKHMGNSAPMKRKYDPMVAEWKAANAVATYGTPRQIDPLSALKEELWRTAGIVSWLEMVVGGLEEDQVTHLIVTNQEKADGGHKLEVIDERTNEYIKLYQQERKHYVQVVKTCIDVGIAERELQLAEQQADAFNTALKAILIDTGVDVTDPEVMGTVRKHLTVAAGVHRAA